MATAPVSPEPGPAGPAPEVPGDPAGPGRPVTGVPGFPDDADRDGDVDVLYLAGQLPAGPEWLLITAVDGCPGRSSPPASCRLADAAPMAVMSWCTWQLSPGTWSR